MEDINNFETYIGRCQHCGKEASVLTDSQATANSLVTESCNCDGAKIEEIRRALRNRMDDICGQYAPEYGFDAIDSDIYNMLLQMCDWIVTDRIHSMTVTIDGTKLTVNNTGAKVKVKRTYTKSHSAEV